MSEPETNEPPQPEKGSDAPSWADGAALGIGCLVMVILLGAAMYFGFVRG